LKILKELVTVKSQSGLVGDHEKGKKKEVLAGSQSADAVLSMQ
jgi:hypothetical protein